MRRYLKIGLNIVVALVAVVILIKILTYEKELTIKHEGNKVKIVGIETKATNSDYALVHAKVHDEIKEYVFNTKDETLSDLTSEHNLLVRNRYNAVKNKSGIIVIYDLIKGKQIMSIDLSKEWNIGDEKLVDLEWSSTQKYLLMYVVSLDKAMLIDVEKKEQKPFPVTGMINTVIWSFDDTKAVLRMPIRNGILSDVKVFLWDLESNKFDELEKDFSAPLQWTPEGKQIYYLPSKEDGSKGYNIEVYDIAKAVWRSSSLIDKRSIDERNIKWVSENEVIFLASDRTKSVIPWLAYFKRFEYYAVKVNLDNGTTIIKKLEADLLRDFIWSSNNKYIYYVDDYGFHKQKIDF